MIGEVTLLDLILPLHLVQQSLHEEGRMLHKGRLGWIRQIGVNIGDQSSHIRIENGESNERATEETDGVQLRRVESHSKTVFTNHDKTRLHYKTTLSEQ